jgi:hypothetical protein
VLGRCPVTKSRQLGCRVGGLGSAGGSGAV